MSCSVYALNFSTFIALLWLIVSMLRQVQADISLVNASNHTISLCHDYPTSFSGRLPSGGLWGHHVFSEPKDGCGSLLPPPSGRMWFAVILHTRKCHNIDRALHAQGAGFKAVIIYLNNSAVIGDDEKKSQIDIRVKIPTAVVGSSCVPILLQYEKDLNTFTVLTDNSSENTWLFLVVGVSGIAFVILCSGTMAWSIHRCCGKKKTVGLLTRSKLSKLKVHTYQSGDAFEVCAICIENYQIGDKLRILPCAHAFHCKCVDVWLTENRKTCPLCNKAADTRRRRRSRRRNNRINECDDERTPLLSDDQLPGDQTDDGRDASDIDQNVPISNLLPSVSVRRPGERLQGCTVGQSVVEVYDEPVSHGDRPRNYGSISTFSPTVFTALGRNNLSSMGRNMSASSNVSQDSTISSCSSCPADFYIGSFPRDAGAEAVSETGLSQGTESASQEAEPRTGSAKNANKPA